MLLTIPKARKKGSGKTFILLFKKNLQGNPVNTGKRRDMRCCPYNPGVPGLSEKNVTDKCYIDIKTKADKEDEG